MGEVIAFPQLERQPTDEETQNWQRLLDSGCSEDEALWIVIFRSNAALSEQWSDHDLLHYKRLIDSGHGEDEALEILVVAQRIKGAGNGN